MKELLDTDRVNFLIWRHLLESNYRESAAKLQKEWRQPAPHRHFDFAQHISPYALVTLLNKGLLYEAYERKFQETQQVSRDVPLSTAEARGVFGPLIFEQQARPEDEEEDDDDSDIDAEHDEIDNPRKRPHAMSNGSPAKRQRVSNGYENGDSATTPMDIDHHADNNHAYPSPLEGEQPASPLPRTQGPDQGTQVDKVHELTHETVFLRLGADDATDTTSPARASENPLLLHAEWNPQDPSVLAVAGTDALARVWTVARGAAPDTLPDHVNGTSRPFHNLLDDDDLPRNAMVNALAWSPSGSLIALAVQDVDSGRARVLVMGRDGTLIHSYDGLESPVLNLRWSPNNDYVLGISPESGGIEIIVVASSAGASLSAGIPIPGFEQSTDVPSAWINDTDFVMCGSNAMISYRCTPNGIEEVKKFNTGTDELFCKLQYDPRSKLIATASENGAISVWNEAGERGNINAHVGLVTALQWQPLQTDAADDERFLASGGMDGAVCIWSVQNLTIKPKYSPTTMLQPIAALSMTPDGAFIAAATSERILIWKVEDLTFPRAIWRREPHPGWQSPKAGAESDEEFEPCLGWDAEGHRLVYGANSRLAVINFR